MSYLPVKQGLPAEEVASATKEVDLGEGSETDIEIGDSPGRADEPEESSSILNWKRLGHLPIIPTQSLFQKMVEAKVPLIVSVHFLVFNLILAIALGSLLIKNSTVAQQQQPAAKLAGTHPPGELLYTIGEDVTENRIERAYVGPGYSEGFVPSAYQGWPTEESDALWKKYEDGNHVRITKEEAEKLPYPTERVPLEEHKDEYVVGLVVFHHLHCLSALRRAIYPKRYNSSLFDGEGNVIYEHWHHVDHCIEILRTYLECHPETTAMTMQWVPESTMAVHPTTLHTCRNFDVISHWAYERSVMVPVRAHWENGKLVDYTGKPYGKEYKETWVLEAPADFNYTKDDMI